MIWCRRDELMDYLGMSEWMDRAIGVIQACDLTKLAHGQNELCEGICGNRFDYVTQPADSMLYETHVRYADVHLLLSGEENVAVAAQQKLREVERKPEKDYIGSSGEAEAVVRLTPERVLIVFPGEAHKARCCAGQPQKVEKFVVKVPLA